MVLQLLPASLVASVLEIVDMVEIGRLAMPVLRCPMIGMIMLRRTVGEL